MEIRRGADDAANEDSALIQNGNQASFNALAKVSTPTWAAPLFN
ncbi:MAG: hypothetical protein QG555_769, partial [Thermodesulfobacteriota bacterium]|nr:hypothetical protein [Thermodesulfobacteriota bacterium]